MNAESMERFESAVTAGLPKDGPPHRGAAAATRGGIPCGLRADGRGLRQSVKALEARLAINMDTGTVLTATDHAPWLSGRRPRSIRSSGTDTASCSRWTVGARPSLMSSTASPTSSSTSLGDPTREGAWHRRGLVMGDVQSGKTGTYTGLICKAADAGSASSSC